MKPEIEMQTTKSDLIAKGYTALTKEELLEYISNTTVIGDYAYNGHRVYKSFMNANDQVTGKNDWGSYEEGRWSIDKNGLLSVSWEGYWEEWTGVAFKVDDAIKFYDIQTGRWRTTFNHIKKGEHDLTVE